MNTKLEQLKDEVENQWESVKATRAVYMAEQHVWHEKLTQLRALLLQGAIEGNPECKELLESGRY